MDYTSPMQTKSNGRSLPQGWQWVKLGECTTKIGSGITPRGGHAAYLKSGIPLIRSQNVYMNGFSYDGLAHISVEQDEQMNKSRVFPDDVLLNITGASIGRVCVVPLEICPANVNQHVCIIRCVDTISPEFLAFYLSNPNFQKFIFDMQAGATRQALTKEQIENFLIPLPPLDEQRRIAARLNEQLAAVESARQAAEEQLDAARELPSAYLRGVFADSTKYGWKWQKLGDVCELLTAKTIKSIGDTIVTAITTACLSESGFLPNGLKSARMDANDAKQASVKEGEILIARSNTPELVGRVSMYPGNPPDVVASDLTIRIWASPVCYPPFLTAYLSYLYLSGFWKEMAGGASGSMKKITRTQVLDVSVPVPDIETQKKIVSEMQSKMDCYRQLEQSLESQLAEIECLPGSLLREAFGGI